MKRVKQLMPLFRRQLSRHQHRSCSLCSKPAEDTTSLLYSYRKIQELLTNKDELVQHLCSNVVYEDGNVQFLCNINSDWTTIIILRHQFHDGFH